MTTHELRSLFNNTYGLEGPWPETYEVDAETYGNVCHDLIDHYMKRHDFDDLDGYPGKMTLYLIVGLHGGVIFKGVEIILKKPDEHKPNT